MDIVLNENVTKKTYILVSIQSDGCLLPGISLSTFFLEDDLVVAVDVQCVDGLSIHMIIECHAHISCIGAFEDQFGVVTVDTRRRCLDVSILSCMINSLCYFTQSFPHNSQFELETRVCDKPDPP